MPIPVRLPNRAYRLLERAYVAQRHIRHREAQRRMEAEDRSLRAWAYRKSINHDGGVCGGRAAGCPYFPCVRSET